jgi:hypothetical protein
LERNREPKLGLRELTLLFFCSPIQSKMEACWRRMPGLTGEREPPAHEEVEEEEEGVGEEGVGDPVPFPSPLFLYTVTLSHLSVK